jgi:FUS-interacting serine-arginine-rich protein 1
MSRHRGGPPTSTLYVRNISDRVRYDDLRRLFSKYGRIVDVVIPLDYYSGNPKGYCFVEYEDTRDAEEAQYRMDRQRLFGREIEVEFARGIRKSSSEMRTRDRHFTGYGGRGGGGGGGGSGMRDDRYGGDGRRGGGGGGGRSRSNSRDRGRGGERRGGGGGPGEERGGPPRSSRSRSRSHPTNRTPSPAPRNHRYKSASKDRSRSPHDRSESPRKRSVSPRRHANQESRSVSRERSSPVMNKRSARVSRSRTQSPA